MAEIVLGFGSSHGPTIGTPPEQWAKLGAKDMQDVRFDFEAARRNVRPDIEEQITIERMRERSDACDAGMAALTSIIQDAAPDVIVVLSNPHGGVTQDRMQPTFGLWLDDSPPFTEAPGRSGLVPVTPPEGRAFPTDPDLARHLMNTMVEDGFDLAASFQSRPGAGLDSAFLLLYQRYLKDGTMPFVPFLLSRYLPNQATPARCYALGQSLRRAIEAWDSPKRVAIMASGGLSHQIIDEELDHTVIDALVENDVETLRTLDRGKLNGAPGTPEILNWVACAGAMDPKSMTLIDYVPCYRSVAGTGHGVTFGHWS